MDKVNAADTNAADSSVNATQADAGPSSISSPGTASKQILDPKENINLRILLQNGKRVDRLFIPETSIALVRESLFADWPKDWNETDVAVASADAIRILHRGRFLEGHATLTGCGMPIGHTTTVHLVPKSASAPQPLPENHAEEIAEQRAQCKCTIC